jgi:hypothetical protein
MAGNDHENVKNVLTNGTSDSAPATSKQAQFHDATKRRFIKAGVIAAPIMLTLKGRAAMSRPPEPSPGLSQPHSQAGINQLDQDPDFRRG